MADSKGADAMGAKNVTPAKADSADPADDQKAKFLAALERKQKGHAHPSGGSAGKGPSGAYGEHAAEANKREFRRKSGG